jgi:glycosyltransferase involved in cell wall biosynthesis
LPLLVIGSGPDEKYLKKIAHDNITFTGHIYDPNERIALLQKAR